ncbi:hypothetical protein [Leptolyngbya sp. FACHB-261]|uniref:hypothetical protein n=1 Tax=Leptolyngbya sp. FACHB-261 TaxID=2692806 RepID=UPI0016876705|nr:hypothetical protein [Leptolyngbya sp. FACHB-261]MBD2099694.1 hypothetical protein [Leptolyngbya sp. FACHB-261]
MRTTSSKPTKTYIPSEQYRQMLVQDGERRFREWHTNFLKLQAEFLADQKQRRR